MRILNISEIWNRSNIVREFENYRFFCSTMEYTDCGEIGVMMVLDINDFVDFKELEID